MAYLKEMHDILAPLKIARDTLNGITNPTTEESTALTNVNSALSAARNLREKLVGQEDTMYAYQCNSTLCKAGRRCTKEINHLIADATKCDDSGESGEANWVQTGTRIVT